MNERQKEVMQAQVDREKEILNRLKLVYAQAQDDCANKIIDLSRRRDMENIQSIIYQKKYQEAIDSFTTSLEINEFQAHTHFRRALAYYEVNEFENSMNDLDAAIKLGMKQEEYKFLQEKLVQKFGMNM